MLISAKHAVLVQHHEAQQHQAAGQEMRGVEGPKFASFRDSATTSRSSVASSPSISAAAEETRARGRRASWRSKPRRKASSAPPDDDLAEIGKRVQPAAASDAPRRKPQFPHGAKNAGEQRGRRE